MEIGKSTIEAVKQASPDLLAGLIVCVAKQFFCLSMYTGVGPRALVGSILVESALVLAMCFVTARIRRSKPLWVYVLAWMASTLVIPALIAVIDPSMLDLAFSNHLFLVVTWAILAVLVDVIAHAIHRSKDKPSEN